MSVTVPTKVEFDALTAKVTALTTAQLALGAQQAALAAELATAEGRISVLEAIPPPVIIPPLPVVTAPLTVTDLAVVAVTDTSFTVRFTEVSDGAGAPASYELRYLPGAMNWGAASVLPLTGTTIGTVRDVVIVGRLPSTMYQAQMVSYRGTLNLNAVFGALSGVVTATTTVPVVVPPPVIVPPSGLLFASDWLSGTPKDNWDLYDEWTGGLPLGTMMQVVPGFAPGGRNALKVMQRGEKAAAVRKQHIITPGVDYYVGFYFRNDDTSSSGDHCVTCDIYQYGNLTFLRKSSGPTDWQHIISVYGCGFVYPIGHWHLRDRLANGAFYRMAFFVHWTSPTAIQVHPRVYDAAGVLRYSDADYLQEDFGSSGVNWGGSDRWTLESYYAAGHDFCVVPQWLNEFSVGNNGQAGAIDTGLAWYFAGVEIRSDRWPGP